MTRYQIIDGKRVQLTSKEEAERDADIKAYVESLPSKRMVELRRQRNLLLAETDFYALSDVTMKDNMKTYRQELRDITKKFQSMEQKDFKFPTKPTDWLWHI